jgi:hypothetical protein
MCVVPVEEREHFPAAGARARRFKRFERDLQAWLATPEGRFAAWRARRSVSVQLPRVTVPSAPRADH